MKTFELMEQLGRGARSFEVPLREVEGRLAELASQEAQIDADIAEALSQLSRMQLEHGSDVGHEAATVLRLRAAEEREQRADLKVIEKEIAGLLAQVPAVNAQIEQAEARLRDHLYGDPDFVAAIKTRNTAKVARDQFEQDGQELWDECERKLPAYDQQPLYAYLLKAGYGEPRYRGSGLTRTMDDWIARLCNYRENRVSQLALLGMRDELTRRRDMLGAQLEHCEQVIAAATEQAGKKAGMDAARRGLRELEEKIAAAKRRAGEMNEQLAAYADCADPRYVRARELVARQLGEHSIDELVRKAKLTHSLADDELVIRLSDMYEKRQGLLEQRRALNEQRQANSEKYGRAKSLERELRGHQQVNSRGSFDGLDWGAMFVGYMAGSLSSGDVERTLTNAFHREIGFPDTRAGSGSDSGSDSFGTSDSSGDGSYSSSDSF